MLAICGQVPLAELGELLTRNQIQVTPGDGLLIVHNAAIEQVGDLAGAAGITLHELAGVQGSLEEAFMQLTGDSVEYGGHGFSAGTDPMLPAGAPGSPPPPPPPAGGLPSYSSPEGK